MLPKVLLAAASRQTQSQATERVCGKDELATDGLLRWANDTRVVRNRRIREVFFEDRWEQSGVHMRSGIMSCFCKLLLRIAS